MRDAAHREIGCRASGEREGESDRDAGQGRLCQREQNMRQRQRGDRRQRARRDRSDQPRAARMDRLRCEKRSSRRKRVNCEPDQQRANQDSGNDKEDQPDDHS